jgi:hypothetical protein
MFSGIRTDNTRPLDFFFSKPNQSLQSYEPTCRRNLTAGRILIVNFKFSRFSAPPCTYSIPCFESQQTFWNNALSPTSVLITSTKVGDTISQKITFTVRTSDRPCSSFHVLVISVFHFLCLILYCIFCMNHCFTYIIPGFIVINLR